MYIGILTFHHVANYGAVLQCYALKKSLEHLGHKCEIIPYECKKLNDNEKLLKLNKKVHINLIKFISQYYGNSKKRKQFDLFLKEYCNIKRNTNYVSFDKYDVVVVGSDQVWNLKLTNNDYKYYLEDNGYYKKVSYAASFGENEIKYDDMDRMISDLKQFDFITVRENKAKDFLSNQGVKSQTVCDPVILMDKNIWYEMVKNKTIKDEKYILIYCIEKSKTVFDFAREISKEKNLKIIYLNQNMLMKEKGFEYRYGVSPIEFLQYIYYADYIVTNSFHGSALSIIFNKQFASDAIWHNKTNNRIDELLCMVNLQDRTIQNIKNSGLSKMYEKIDFAGVNDNILKYSNKSKNFIEMKLKELKER